MRFLGNKARMLENIASVLTDKNIEGAVFCDLFAGSGAVGDYFKDRFSVISNDCLYSLSVINRAKLENARAPEFAAFRRKYKVDPFTYFNNKTYEFNLQYFVTGNYSPRGGRRYFTEENAIKIDGIRLDIEGLYQKQLLSEQERIFLIASLLESVMGISNTTGTYEAFLKNWDKRACKPLELAPITVNEVEGLQQNAVYNTDSNELIRRIEGDILYIDPPYTVTDYSSAYHVLESIAKYDYPVVSGITGRRKENGKKSKYTRREQALKNFEDLFRQANFKHVLISYSTQGLVSVAELKALASRFAVNGEVDIYEFPFREYKNIRSSKKGDDLKELVIYFEKDREILRSPLNYTGSKYGIFHEITKVFPKHISTFVDAMAGAFNVGVNVVADKVVYNEFLPHTYDIIEFLLQDNKQAVIDKVEEIVQAYGMQKGNKEAYMRLRADYNATKDVYKLFVLHMYCFQNQMRFNGKLEFNTPVGNCSYNETLTERILKFAPKTACFELKKGSYADIDLKTLDKDTVFYFDPPYFITSATYNDGKRGFIGWNAEEETRLLEYLSLLNDKGFKFILSNVLQHNDASNHLLKEWIKTHNFYCKDIGQVGAKNARNEVLITNFDWRDN
ncbi:MAG: Dam family site-specific DNA-(adenine-N6)-methyltransferase [Clostridia bacterium]|nr:Dam family site-specific DNA-(adenine-N6)-methyltransferase [Clostridia bacterium]